MAEQQHPQYSRDREAVNQLLAVEQPGDYELAELARLRIRYMGFPGARDIWQDLEATLARWQLSEDELFRQTRAIHQAGTAYQESFSNRDDWA